MLTYLAVENDMFFCNIIHICSGITRGRVLNGELYAQRLQSLIICRQLKRNLHETVCR